MSHMQPADSARHTAYMIVYGKIYTAYLDITDSRKDLAWILAVGSRISHVQLAETARYTAYILACGKIYAVYLDITDSWKDLA